MRDKKKGSSKENTRQGINVFKISLIGLAVLALGAIGYAIVTSGLFSLRQVEVTGNKRLTTDAVRQIVGLKGGENLLGLSSAGIAKIAKDSPWVVNAKVRKEYPSKLLLNVQESMPEAILEENGGRYLVDSDGKVLEKLSGAQELFLPVIVSEKGVHGQSFVEAIALARVISDAGLLKEKQRVEIVGHEQGATNITIKMDGLIIKVGEGNYNEKLSRLFELFEQIKKLNINIEYIDLRFANRVIVKHVSDKAVIEMPVGGGVH